MKLGVFNNNFANCFHGERFDDVRLNDIKAKVATIKTEFSQDFVTLITYNIMAREKYLVRADDGESQLRFNVGKGKDFREVLRLLPDGKIIWTIKGKEIIVKKKSVLAIALLDVVINFTNWNYDYSKLDAKLFKRYKNFLKTFTGGNLIGSSTAISTGSGKTSVKFKKKK